MSKALDCLFAYCNIPKPGLMGGGGTVLGPIDFGGNIFLSLSPK